MSNNRTCLLIDDDVDDQEIFEMALKSVNPSIVFMTAVDGVDALEKLAGPETLKPDYIFLDLNMPRMDGKECLREIRKINRLKEIPVIIYSTSAEQKDKQETKALGADFYLEKQPSINSLKKKLSDFFNG